ncbi:MAG: ABC transporter ATP-binding protein [Planctomycetes bacterium]|nr:ABC transporter ATP-binding protein [Planctomycetota bacterium]
MAIVLQCEKLTKSFEGLIAVKNVSYALEEGVLSVIIGPNGSGKTTFVNLLSGAIPASEGRILLHGHDITKLQCYERVKLGIGRTFQLTNIFRGLTVIENVIIGLVRWQQGSLAKFMLSSFRKDVRIVEEAKRILVETHLFSEKDALASNIPNGSQRRLEIAVCLSTKPKVVLLDEPMAGLTAEEMEQMVRFINEDLATKHVILVIEHRLGAIMKLADRITVMRQGSMIISGTPEEVKNSILAQEAYLGK